MTTTDKIRNAKRPKVWTKNQREAHTGNHPKIEQQIVVFKTSLPEDEKERKEKSLKFRLNQFLVNVGALILFRKDLPDVSVICKNFLRDFDAKVDEAKLHFTLNAYTVNFFETDKQFSFPRDLLHGNYDRRREEILKLREEFTKELCGILKDGAENVVSC